MMIQSIGAISNNTNTNGTVKKPQPAKPSFEGLGVNKAPKTMKALAAAAILGMAAVGMSSCKQPTDPTVIEIPAEDPTTEDPEIEDPVVEDPTIETPTVDIANAPIVKAIKEMGFGIDVVEVAPVEGLYTPEAGDLVDLKFNDRVAQNFYHMQLDREKSTKDNLVYNGNAIYTLYNEEYDIHEDFDKMIFDKENYALIFADVDGSPIMTMRIVLDENNNPIFMYSGWETDFEERPHNVKNGEVFKPPGIDQFGGFEFQLAK